MTDKIIVDIGADDNGVAFIYNVEDGKVISKEDEDNNILDLLMNAYKELEVSPDRVELYKRDVDYTGDDEFDKWLDESSIGEFE